MIEEEKFKQLKAATIKKYKDYIIEIEKTSINDLHDWRTRRRLVENFALTVEANTAYRNFIARYKMIEQPKQTNN